MSKAVLQAMTAEKKATAATSLKKNDKRDFKKTSESKLELDRGLTFNIADIPIYNSRADIRIQPKLRINQPDDQYEKEADAKADQVMRMKVPSNVKCSSHSIQPSFNNGETLRRKCAECEKEEKDIEIHRKGSNHLPPTIAPPVINDALNSPGRPMDPGTLAFMESRFNHDFSDVKIHTDSLAAISARSVNAKAYTSGNQIVFDDGEYSPNTYSGKRLLAHELTHVIQQNRTHSLKRGIIQRSCRPLPKCPSTAVEVTGSGYNWEAAEICLQQRYKDANKGIIGINKDWKSLTAPKNTAERRDLECFKSHLVGKSGSFLAEPDIIDFTAATIYDVTTKNGASKHRVRLEADTTLATKLSKEEDCSGASRKWKPGKWEPSPCYAFGAGMFMKVKNDKGLLIYQMLKDEKSEKEEEEKRRREEAAKPIPVKIVDYEPLFSEHVRDAANIKVPRGNDLIIAIESNIYNAKVQEFLNQQTRIMRVDPRSVPSLQLHLSLLPVAAIAAVIEVAALIAAVGMIVVASGGTAIAPVAVAGGEVGAAATTAAIGTTATTGTGAILTVISGGGGATAATASATMPAAVIKLSQAAAVAGFLALGASDAKAAEMAKPFINQPILLVMNVTNNKEAAEKPIGETISSGGSAFKIIIKMTTR